MEQVTEMEACSTETHGRSLPGQRVLGFEASKLISSTVHGGAHADLATLSVQVPALKCTEAIKMLHTTHAYNQTVLVL